MFLLSNKIFTWRINFSYIYIRATRLKKYVAHAITVFVETAHVGSFWLQSVWLVLNKRRRNNIHSFCSWFTKKIWHWIKSKIQENMMFNIRSWFYAFSILPILHCLIIIWCINWIRYNVGQKQKISNNVKCIFFAILLVSNHLFFAT